VAAERGRDHENEPDVTHFVRNVFTRSLHFDALSDIVQRIWKVAAKRSYFPPPSFFLQDFLAQVEEENWTRAIMGFLLGAIQIGA
jgi:hypothetical protein